MPTMKSSREMAIASSSRKRAEPTPDSDSESSHSDFSKTTKPSSRANKKSRTTTTTTTSAKNAATALSTSTSAIKLPKPMTCPEGRSAFTKPYWKDIAETDEFWTYLKNMIPASVWNKRLGVEIRTDLITRTREVREAREANKGAPRGRGRKPSAKKGGPVSLGFEARDLNAEDGEDFVEVVDGGDEDVVGETENGEKDGQDDVGGGVGAAGSSGMKATVALSEGPSPALLKQIEEQKRLFAVFEAAKAKAEAGKKADAEVAVEIMGGQEDDGGATNDAKLVGDTTSREVETKDTAEFVDGKDKQAWEPARW